MECNEKEKGDGRTDVKEAGGKEERKESPGSVEKNIKSPDTITQSVRYFNLASTMCRTRKLYPQHNNRIITHATIL